MSTEQYIDLLTEAERRNLDKNAADRAEELQELKNRCKMKRKVLSGEFTEYNMSHVVEPLTEEKDGYVYGILKKMTSGINSLWNRVKTTVSENI